LDLEPVALADMPGGTRIGTLVHEVFEAVDFAAEELGEEVAARLDERLARRTLDVGDRDAVVAGLTAALETPLGGALGGVRLRDIARADRVDEMAFELPLAGGEVPIGALTPGAIAAALRRHLPADDPLHRYAARLETGELRSRLHGYLTGSLDLVLRVPGPDGGRPRYAIADYKTNRLGDYTRPLTAWDHRPAALETAMADSHYFLQGLLYAVALHRFLRWRLPDYDAGRDLAGVFYLFVRGMTGGDEPGGVVAFKPPGALLDELSDVLDRGVAT
jgi:exodeoxyribonuclease V beta subunit